jgi:TadE-like protein
MKEVGTVLQLIRDDRGGVLVEVTLMLTVLIFFIFGSIDFLFAFYEWNAATKAVQVGARIAAVSNPVARGFDSLSAAFISATLRPGSPMPSFTITCDGRAAKCKCEGFCLGGVIAYDASAMDTIIYGRGSKACGDAHSIYTTGMCDIFNRITPANVRIEYRQPISPAGLGFVGRPGGPVPLITVSLQNIPFRFIFLGFILHDIQIPRVATTVTGEDLYSCAPAARTCEDGP